MRPGRRSRPEPRRVLGVRIGVRLASRNRGKLERLALDLRRQLNALEHRESPFVANAGGTEFHVLDLVAASPGMFPRYDDEHRFVMLRRFPYSVVYQIQRDQILVVAVAHSSRSPGYWQGRA